LCAQFARVACCCLGREEASKAKEIRAHLEAGRVALEKKDYSVALRHAGAISLLSFPGEAFS
jgi:hypothetical protein